MPGSAPEQPPGTGNFTAGGATCVLNRRRAVPAAFLAVAVAAGISACGSAGSGSARVAAAPSATATATPSPTASKDPLAGLTSGQIAGKALTDTETAPSVTFLMNTIISGHKTTVDFTIIYGKGCEGTMSESGQGSFKGVYNGKTAWVDGSKLFWQTSLPAAASVLAGKYIKTTSKQLTDAVTSFCDLKTLLGGGGIPPGGMIESHTTIDGKPVVELKDTGDQAGMYISDTRRPAILKVVDPGSGGGTMTFTRYDATAALTYPPASDVINGSQYGL